MSNRDAPPRVAERILTRLVGPREEARTILGDAREEFHVRGRTSRLGSTLWYWGYVIRFAVTYRGGVRAGHAPSRPNGGSFASAMLWDTGASIRMLWRRRWLSASVIATLAVGIGATTVAFAMADHVLLRPLPYPEPGELIELSRVDPEWFGPNPTALNSTWTFATPMATVLDWQASLASFQHLGGYAPTATTVTGAGTPVRISGVRAHSGVFASLGVHAALGRVLLPSDDEVGAPRVVVISRRFWASQFGSDPSVIGRAVALNGVPTTVVGVMPSGFDFPGEGTDFFMNFEADRMSDPTRAAGYLHAVGRLDRDVTLERARAEVGELKNRLGEAYADEAPHITLVFSLQETIVSGVRPAILLMLASATLVLLVGCANVANLLLARVTERKRELAVRVAMGAGMGRLGRSLVTESTILAVLGGLGGATLARIGLGPFMQILPMSLPTSDLTIDGRVLGACLLISLVVGAMTGIIPLFRSRKMNLNGTLRDGGHGSTGGAGTSRSTHLLVVAEATLAVLLLSASGLFLQSYSETARIDRGFDSSNLLTYRLTLGEDQASSSEVIEAYFDELVSETAAIPGVISVTHADQMPLNGCCSSPPMVLDIGGDFQSASIQQTRVRPSYFETMVISLRKGRLFDGNDRAGAPPVAIISEAMADRYWPNEDAVGQRFRHDADDVPWFEVVGVVSNIRYRFGANEAAQFYRPFSQGPRPFQALAIRTAGMVPGVSEALVRTVHSLDADQPVVVRSMEDRISSEYSYRVARVGSWIVASLAAVATVLAIIGMYGVMSYNVARRTREIGIRASLGAGRRTILGGIMGSGLSMSGVGLGLGLLLFLASKPLLDRGPMPITEVDARIWIYVTLTVVVTSIMACLIPALRAMRIDPMVAFRDE